MTRVLLADDHALVRHGLRMILDAEPDFEVVAEASDGQEAVAMGLRDQIELALLDVAMPRLTGIQAARTRCGQRRFEPAACVRGQAVPAPTGASSPATRRWGEHAP